MSSKTSEGQNSELLSPADLSEWLLEKWRSRLNDSGKNFQTVAKQMRKQGYPLEVALLVLTGRRRHL